MPKPANLIFFLTDNHNREFLGAAGHPMVRTPNLDGIARRGVRFSNAYCASPLCCPSRAAIAISTSEPLARIVAARSPSAGAKT